MKLKLSEIIERLQKEHNWYTDIPFKSESSSNEIIFDILFIKDNEIPFKFSKVEINGNILSFIMEEGEICSKVTSSTLLKTFKSLLKKGDVVLSKVSLINKDKTYTTPTTGDVSILGSSDKLNVIGIEF